MTRLALFALLALALAPAALAQTSSDALDLDVNIDGFAQIVSLDDIDTPGDGALVFQFSPGLDATNPEANVAPAAVALDDRITFATNYATSQKVDIAISATNVNHWNDLTITVTPGAISPISTSTSTAGAAGSCGSTGASSDLTANATAIAVASGITLCHATQVVSYSVALDDITADESDRSFDVTYTILATN